MNTYKESPAGQIRSHNPLVGTVIKLMALFVLAAIAYSIYVALHEPDPQETIVLGQTKLAAGTPAALRILVRNRVSGKPVSGAEVQMRLQNKQTTIHLGRFHTDTSGSLTDPLGIPEIAAGEYELIIESKSSLGRDRVIRKVEIQHPARILLSCDKPIYQPGQTIHVRSLLLNGRTEKPFTNTTVTFEVSDPKGNKVFKETRKTSSFGIASADFVLATELNLGRYELRALAGPAITQRTVEIKPYVLPKFKVQLTTAKPYYLPGETVSGTVAADYFFGKPLNSATVELSALTLQEKAIALTNLSGQTDASGKYSFEFLLPDFFVGMPQNNEQAFLDLTAQVRDAAGHAEEKTLSLSVAQNELEVTAIPEAGVLIPGVENILYVLTAYPDGRPALCNIFVDGKAYQGSPEGLCEVKLQPTALNQAFDIQAIDESGRKQKLTYYAETNRSTGPFLLRADKAVYKAGETARISIVSAEKNNTVFIDVLKDGQTVLTKSVDLANHKADYSLTLPVSLIGALKLNAYVITQTGEDRACSRILYVSPASGLRIATKPSQSTYRPGEIARLDFSVTDVAGKPAPAALGIAVVDESVFGLQGNRPGLLKQFLDVEGEMLKPRYQIKFFDSPARLLETGNQSLAAAYFASLEEMHNGPGLDDLVSDGYVPQKLIQQVREMRGTPAYEKYRSDPEYAAVVRLLEGTQGLYSLREATGPAKLQAVAAHRQAYFRNLQRYLQTGVLILLFLSPVLLLLYYSRPGAGIDPRGLGKSQATNYVRVAGSLHNVLAVLILLPLICYPVGFFALERMNNPGFILLGFETVVVLLTLFAQHIRILAATTYLHSELAPLRVFLGSFFVQFVVSRGGFLLMALYPRDIDGPAILWTFASILAPLLVLGSLSSHVRRQLAAKGITGNIVRITVLEVLVVLAVLCILGAMLLPALARAKARSQNVWLLNDLKQLDLANQSAQADAGQTGSGGSVQPRVRRDFPETLFWRPELITDDYGKATLEIPLADSITTWRASIDAVNAAGRLGSAEMPITVFQDFFVDLDTPVSLSLGDQVSLPVTCYNYLKEPQDIRLTLTDQNWFQSPIRNIQLHLGPNEIKSVSFPIAALRAGNYSLRVTAQGARIADAIEREIRVVPTGDRHDYSKTGVLKDSFADVLTVPSEIITDSQSLWVKFYPSRFTEVVEGLESVFQAPYGCFEQTSSTTYPNVLVLDYLKRMGRLAPEAEVKARKYINAGYQRLLTFEVPGGGFEWFGHSPAHVGLTAYGILEFTDMSSVHPVDQALVARTRQWLLSQQNADGSWNQSGGLDSWSAQTPVTAYIAWALAESGDQSPNLDKALNYLHSHLQQFSSPYQKALTANAFLARDRNDTFGRQLAAQIKEAAIPVGKNMCHWTSDGQSITYSHDFGMDVETTALSATALMKAGFWPVTVKQALGWLSGQKQPNGTWGSTQATILAMRALLAGSTASFGQEFESAITLYVNGQLLETFQLNKDNSDVMKQVNLSKFLRIGENQVQFRQTPAGELPFQLTGNYWLPVAPKPADTSSQIEPLQIAVRYDRTALPVNDKLQCNVSVKNNTRQLINMAIVDLGIPPGFDVDSTAFEAMQQRTQIARFEVTGSQIILYLRELSDTTPFQFNYSLRAKYPLRIQTPPSSVYEYYQPQNRAESKPVILQALAN